MNPLYQQLHERIATEVQFLPDKPEETPESTLKALWLTAAGIPVSAERALQEKLPDLDAGREATLRSFVDRRLAGTPLAHITGRQQFVGMEMLAGPGALVPRKETEVLARIAIELANDLVAERGRIRVIDVCTGSGNVALAIAHHVAQSQVYAADLSEEAVSLARENARHLQLQSRTEFAAGDLLAPFDKPELHGTIDLLTCNPPYISSAKVDHMHQEIAAHEPHLAFDGGPFGVNILMRLLQDAPRFLNHNGWLAFEVGLGQGKAMNVRLAKTQGCKEVRPLLDEQGAIRALAGRFERG
jgi:release factor glutamine methyltransferase